jgi:peptide/nickel transport system substrate-binding protein
LKVPFCAVYWGNRPTIDNQFTSTFANGTTNPWNDTHYTSAEFNKILVAARVELDQKKRAEMYAKCQSMLNQESGMVCFAVQDYLDGASKKLRGLTISGRYDLGDQRIAEKGWFA